MLSVFKKGYSPYCLKSEQFQFSYSDEPVRMRKTTILIFVASGDCVENMEMYKSEEEVKTDYTKLVTPLSRGRSRKAGPVS
jgi:hypothetical protein